MGKIYLGPSHLVEDAKQALGHEAEALRSEVVYIEKIIEKPVIQIVDREIEVIKEIPVIVHKEIEVIKEVFIDKIIEIEKRVEVPVVQFINKEIEVIKEVEKQIEVFVKTVPMWAYGVMVVELLIIIGMFIK